VTLNKLHWEGKDLTSPNKGVPFLIKLKGKP